MPPCSMVWSMNAPSRMEIIRSAVAAIRGSWVTMTSVCPAWCSWSNRRSTSRRRRCPGCRWARRPVPPAGRRPAPWPSRPAAAGPRTAAWAGTWPGRPARPAPVAPRPAAEPPAASGRPAARAARRSPPRSPSIRWKAWNTNPMASRLSRASARSDIRVMSCPSSQISPAVGRSSPPSRYSSVDLPQPLGPIIATVSPRATSRSTSSTARTKLASRPYSLRSPRVRSTQLPPSRSFMTRPSGLSSSARMPPASADRPADAARCPPAAVRPASDPARPWPRAAHPGAGAAVRGAGCQ